MVNIGRKQLSTQKEEKQHSTIAKEDLAGRAASKEGTGAEKDFLSVVATASIV